MSTALRIILLSVVLFYALEILQMAIKLMQLFPHSPQATPLGVSLGIISIYSICGIAWGRLFVELKHDFYIFGVVTILGVAQLPFGNYERFSYILTRSYIGLFIALLVSRIMQRGTNTPVIKTNRGRTKDIVSLIIAGFVINLIFILLRVF